MCFWLFALNISSSSFLPHHFILSRTSCLFSLWGPAKRVLKTLLTSTAQGYWDWVIRNCKVLGGRDHVSICLFNKYLKPTMCQAPFLTLGIYKIPVLMGFIFLWKDTQVNKGTHRNKELVAKIMKIMKHDRDVKRQPRKRTTTAEGGQKEWGH